MLKLLAFSVVRRRNVLPSSKGQSNGRDLARQRQTSHLRLHAIRYQLTSTGRKIIVAILSALRSTVAQLTPVTAQLTAVAA